MTKAELADAIARELAYGNDGTELTDDGRCLLCYENVYGEWGPWGPVWSDPTIRHAPDCLLLQWIAADWA